MKQDIPKEVRAICALLEREGFQAFLVGGCVRDITLGRVPKDWDVTTNATPPQITKLFPDSVYENEFGTVGVKTDSEDSTLKIIEVTTFRIEGKYTDKRHPEEVRFAKTVEEDLSRRDFTVNALALSVVDGVVGEVIDPFGGQKDLKAGLIRAVGNADERFEEDALRLMRAVRFATELNMEIEKNTRNAIVKHAPSLAMIAQERIRDEFTKMLEATRASSGIILLEELGLLKYVMPELCEGIGVGQNKHHIYTVFEHNVKALEYSAGQGYSLGVRMASLLHDIGKPKTKGGDGPDSTFYNHERVGAKMATRALERLHFSNDFIAEVAHLVKNHMFYYNVGEVSPAGVRRFLVRVGPEYVDDLIKVREADRIGSGVAKAVPYKLRHFLFMIEKVKHDPISPKMLKINGEDVMKILDIVPGQKIGNILSILLEDILDDPARNTEKYLENRVKELGAFTDKALKALADKAKETKGEAEEEVEETIKKKYYVK